MNKSTDYTALRQEMVFTQIMGRGITDKAVIEAMQKVPRHKFVDNKNEKRAYEDHPLPIGHYQTISQPYIIAYMLEQLKLKLTDKVLDIGSGCGYQSAVLAEICKEVYSIEIIRSLFTLGQGNLSSAGYTKVNCLYGDGYAGWPDEAPYDAIIVAAASKTVPPPLLKQLNINGSLIIPIGPEGGTQQLKLFTKTDNEIIEKSLIQVRFVPFKRYSKHQ